MKCAKVVLVTRLHEVKIQSTNFADGVCSVADVFQNVSLLSL
jgi:hypothetical protein